VGVKSRRRGAGALLRRPKWVAAGAGVLVVVLAAGAWGVTRSGGTAAAATSRVVTISAGTLEQTVSSTGTIAPAQKADLSFGVAGTVTSVAAKVGKKVKKGQTLARIDTAALERAVTTAQANRDAAAVALSSVQASGASSTQVSSAQAQLLEAKDRLAAAREDLAAGALTSPITGTVASVALDVGDRVTAGSGSGGTSPSAAGSSSSSSSSSSSAQVVVIATDAWVVDASVGSADLAQIKKGQQARITPTGAGQAVFGTVSSVGIVAASSSGGSATFPVQIKVTGDPAGLYAGGTAAVSLVVRQLQDVLTVPTQALSTSGTDTVVTKVVDGKDVTTPVRVGTSYGPSTQVLSGLVAGDQVRLTDLRAATGTGTNRRTGTGAGGTGGAFPGGAGGFPGGGAFVGGPTGTGGLGGAR
jgi:macrolide-specific efflux system membrane fusion protein